ncbi:fasciclin domain-containing protein [Microlunatus panaciterrae]|uniref:Surface protein with fasciclin (FAS1) repeats n=1 Tax=Microlunatus panaciterrae TaxID=400768 RepID=A0ABS2RK96_9ACTN|nr:putative surface protein with fasciclin (FAS1) repeats [Microlunatus panaciterrae]
MSKTSRITKIAALTAAIVFPLGLAACSGGDSASAGGEPSAAASSAPASSMAPSPSMSMESSGSADAPFGAACSKVPTSGKGSFDGMSKDPVATAASNNPLLTTLVAAVGKAGLGDTLNTTDDITVFAPTDDAFAKLDKKTMDAAMKDPKGLLTDVLTLHVVPGRLAPSELAGEHKTLNGATIKVEGSGEDFTVDGKAMVLCGNVQTANATVYIIDQVLLPKS